jgi:hypothetical protein
MDNFYAFAVASMVTKIAKKLTWTGPANTTSHTFPNCPDHKYNKHAPYHME